MCVDARTMLKAAGSAAHLRLWRNAKRTAVAPPLTFEQLPRTVPRRLFWITLQ